MTIGLVILESEESFDLNALTGGYATKKYFATRAPSVVAQLVAIFMTSRFLALPSHRLLPRGF